MTVKEECFKCGYFNPNIGRFYKCNTSSCPSRQMDLEERKQLIEERSFDKQCWKIHDRLSKRSAEISVVTKSRYN